MAISSRPEIIKARRKNEGKLTHLAFPSKPMPHGLLLQFYDYDYSKYIAGIKQNKDKSFSPNTFATSLNQGTSTIAEISAKNSVELPFPRSLVDAQGARVQGFERDFLYERVASGIAANMGGDASSFLSGVGGNAKGMLDSIKAGSKEFFSDPMAAIKEGLKGLSGVEANKATAIASYLARNVIGGDLAKTLSVVNQRVVNPQETLSFTGVDLKNYTFSWDLFPSNSNDTKQIQEIVQFLKNKMLPETESIDGINGTARAFLKYPSIVELNLLGVQEKHFQQFKRCMISNVTVDYGGGGGMPQIIKGGVPAAVTLTISFSEVQIHTRDDYPLEQKTATSGGAGAA